MSTKKNPAGNILKSSAEIRSRISRAERYLQQHRTRVTQVGVGFAVLLLAYFGYRYYQSVQNEEAQRELFQAVYYFEADSLRRALDGDGINYGFLQVIDQYSGTKAANLSHFYAGVCYLRLGEYTEAVKQLKQFNSSDWLLQARAYALLGDAHMERENYARAAEYYEEAAAYKPNEQFSPLYLKKAALAYEHLQQFEAALHCYTRIVEVYPGAALKEEAKKHIHRLEGATAASP